MSKASTIDLSGRVALVTGAGSGLGRCHALALASRGAAVVVNDVGGSSTGLGSDTSPADSVVDEIRSIGGEALANHDSVATTDGANAMVDNTISAFGRLDIVVSNAGILRDSTISKLADDDLRSVLDVHLVGTILVARAAWSHLAALGDGRMILTASAAGLWGNFGQTAYAAAKGGIVGVGLTLAAEGQRRGIKVNVVAPYARTRLTAELFGSQISDLLDPELVSAFVVALCAADCEVTGEIFSVGGGRAARVATASAVGIVLGPPETSPERILADLSRIRDLDGCSWPASAGEEMRLTLKSVRSRR